MMILVLPELYLNLQEEWRIRSGGYVNIYKNGDTKLVNITY